MLRAEGRGPQGLDVNGGVRGGGERVVAEWSGEHVHPGAHNCVGDGAVEAEGGREEQ
eukprot:gene32073-40546_t